MSTQYYSVDQGYSIPTTLLCGSTHNQVLLFMSRMNTKTSLVLNIDQRYMPIIRDSIGLFIYYINTLII